MENVISIFVALAAMLWSFPVFAAAAIPTDQPSQLKQLLAAEWEYELRESPELATSIGDYRYNDRWSDSSLAHVQQQRRDLQQWLDKFQALDSAGLNEQDRLSLQVMVRNLKERIEGIDLKTFEMPVDQFNGIQLELAQFVAIIPFDSTKHYEEYLSRVRQIPTVIDQNIEVLQQGKKDGLMPPKFLLEKAVEQCRQISGTAGEASAFGQPVTKFPDNVPEADRKRLHDAIVAAVDHDVRPAYAKLAEFLAKDYAPYGR